MGRDRGPQLDKRGGRIGDILVTEACQMFVDATPRSLLRCPCILVPDPIVSAIVSISIASHMLELAAPRLML